MMIMTTTAVRLKYWVEILSVWSIRLGIMPFSSVHAHGGDIDHYSCHKEIDEHDKASNGEGMWRK